MTSWRRLAAGTVGLFLIILAFLAGQLRAGADPAVGRTAAQTQTQTTPARPDPSTGDDGGGNGTQPYDDGSVPYGVPGDGSSGHVTPGGTLPGDGSSDNGSSGDAAPGGPLPDAAPPTTHQS